jgi:hypothetical protein
MKKLKHNSIVFPTIATRQFKFSRNILPWPVLISDVDKMAASLEKKTVTWIWFTVRLAIKTYVKIGKITEFKLKICQLLKRGIDCGKYLKYLFKIVNYYFPTALSTI